MSTVATKTEKTISQSLTAGIYSTDINSLLRENNLWKPGCQFLSFKEKTTLLNGTKKERKEVYEKLEQKKGKISEALKGQERECNYIFDANTEKESVKGVYIAGNVAELERFFYPVAEDIVYYSNGVSKVPAPNNKAIVTKDGEIISVVKNKYTLITNEQVVMPLLEKLDKLDSKWFIDNSHTYITKDLTRMRLQLTFPDLTFNDGASDVAMSLFINNSYDYSIGVRGMWGAIRGICSNGMVFGKVMSNFNVKHSSQFDVEKIAAQIEQTFELIPVIKERVNLLQQQTFTMTEELQKTVEENIGKKAYKYYEQENASGEVKSMYDFYNVMTYYISHYVNYRQRQLRQVKLSNMMEF